MWNLRNFRGLISRKFWILKLKKLRNFQFQGNQWSNYIRCIQVWRSIRFFHVGVKITTRKSRRPSSVCGNKQLVLPPSPPTKLFLKSCKVGKSFKNAMFTLNYSFLPFFLWKKTRCRLSWWWWDLTTYSKKWRWLKIQSPSLLKLCVWKMSIIWWRKIWYWDIILQIF